MSGTHMATLRRLVGRSSLLMAARLAGAGLAFLGNVAIVRYLGADALGLFALCMATASLIAVFLPLGRQATATLFVSEYDAKRRPDRLSGYVSAGRSIIWRMTAAVAAIAAILWFALEGQISREAFIAGAFALVIAPALAFNSFNGGVLTGAHRPFSALLPESLIKPAFILIAAMVSAAFWSGETIYLLLAIVAAGCWITAGTQAMLLRASDAVPCVENEGYEHQRWQKTAWPWMFISLLWDYFIELQLLLAGMIASTTEVAVLHICFRLRMLAGFGMRALYALILPDLYKANANGNSAELAASLSHANTLALLYSVSVCAAVWLFGEFVLGLIDPSFSSAHLALLVMCLTMVARALFGPATAVLAMAGYQFPSLWTLVAGLAISVALCLVLFPMFGLLGIAIAYLAANSMIAAVQWNLAFRLTGIDSSVFACFRREHGECRGDVSGLPGEMPRIAIGKI